MDLGLGDIFYAWVAGNITNEDLLGNMEFTCKRRGGSS
jgi:carbonic anhydrase